MNSKNAEELANPKCGSGVRDGKDLQLQIYCGGSSPFFGLLQVDAAAEGEEDEVLCGGGGARVTVGLREEEDEERENEERPGCAYL